MNKVILMGRLTREPDVRYSQGADGSMAVARYTLAVDRRRGRNSDNNEQTADFISCVAFGRSGEFAEKYLRKGTKILMEGEIRNNNYTNKDGVMVYQNQIIATSIEFAESKSSQSNNNDYQPKPAPSNDNSWMNIPDDFDDSSLPFN